MQTIEHFLQLTLSVSIFQQDGWYIKSGGGGRSVEGSVTCWAAGESSLLLVRVSRLLPPLRKSTDLRWMPSHSCSCSDWDLGRVWLLGRPPDTRALAAEPPSVGLGLPRSPTPPVTPEAPATEPPLFLCSAMLVHSSSVSSDQVLLQSFTTDGVAHLACGNAQNQTG